MSLRVRGELFNELSKAARDHDLPLGREVEARLERSLADERDLFDPRWRLMAQRLIGHYLVGGAPLVIRLLGDLPDPATFEEPDLAEKRRRHQIMSDQLKQSVFHDPDSLEPRSLEAVRKLMAERDEQREERFRAKLEGSQP
jgi:hypothetical protein